MGDYWVATQEILQGGSKPLVDKPKLSDKYLTKPPFRFLHDIITAVQTNAGFAPGLYKDIELSAKDIQDKEQKVTYLTKIIDVVGLVLGEHVPARPLKIVAGLEPENTNVFLQMLGKAARKSSGADAVKKVLAGGHQPGPGESGAAPRPSSRPSSQHKPEAPAKPAAEAPAKPAAKKAPPEDSHKSSKPEDKAPPAEAKAKSSSSSKPKPPPKEEAKASAPSKDDSKSRSSKPAAPPAGDDESGSADAGADDSSGRTQTTAKFSRPQSARKAPPKVPTNDPTPPAKPGARPGTAQRPASKQAERSGPGPVATKPVQLFEENLKDDADDEVEVVHEATPVIGASMGPLDSANQGVLVKNILEAEKNLKKAGEAAAVGSEPSEASGTGIILKRSGKPTSASAGGKPGDLAAVRDLVQKLCQSSHPLAKSMDYLQEDLENMAKEYRFWVTERRVYQEKLVEEQRLVQDLTNGEMKIADMDNQIKQVRDRNIGHKGQILRNDETVSKLLNMIVSGNR